MSQVNRLIQAGLGTDIDASKPLQFYFNDRELGGFEGDTVASALLANNIHLVARSIKLHRPRGILSAGLEEPSAMVTCINKEGDCYPNLKVTEIALKQGLIVKNQNSWPTIRFDFLAGLSLLPNLLQAGFYYKTFKWPRQGWHYVYETVIRKVAGHGEINIAPHTKAASRSKSDQRNKFCQVLIIGSGPAGLSAALVSGREGAQVVVVEQDQTFGGCLLWRKADEGESSSWLVETLKELNIMPNVTMMTHTMAFGQYDHGMVLAYQSEGLGGEGVFWKIRTQSVLLASGAIERPAVFTDNDRPGIMLANAVSQYICRYAVVPGKNAFLAIADPNESDQIVKTLQLAGIKIAGSLQKGDQIQGTKGRHRIRTVTVKSADNQVQHYHCDLLIVSDGWTPVGHLAAHVQPLNYDHKVGAAIPAAQNGCLFSLGGSRGIFDIEYAINDGQAIAKLALAQIAFGDGADEQVQLIQTVKQAGSIKHTGTRNVFVDLQNDVTRADIIQTAQEGFSDVELLKRYTTTGMGTDQGKTSWVNTVKEISDCTSASEQSLGHTTFRPPYSPVNIAGLIGIRMGEHVTPIRRTPFHAAFENLGCVFQNSGNWLYSRYFPKGSETMEQAVDREIRAIRSGVGFVDMSTLGKIEVKGLDAKEFVSRVYCNNLSNLAIGSVRYGLMLREDGILFDDGTVTHLGDNHYFLTSTTANSNSIWRWLTKLSQIQWPELDVRLTQVSEQWACLAIAGPQSRTLCEKLGLGIDFDPANFPLSSLRIGFIDREISCRVFSVSFSGEQSFEVNVPAGYATSLVERIFEVGQGMEITPYGLETLDVLRIEKGHLSVGTEIDGRTTPYDLGLQKLVSRKKDFIGKALLNRPSLKSNHRLQLVGLTALNKSLSIPVGGLVVDQSLERAKHQKSVGMLTASIFSPVLDRYIALALVKNGRKKIGEHCWVVSPTTNQSTEVLIGDTCFYDAEGKRLRGK